MSVKRKRKTKVVVKETVHIGAIFTSGTVPPKSHDTIQGEKVKKNRQKNKAARAARKVTHAAMKKDPVRTGRTRALTDAERSARIIKANLKIEAGAKKKAFKIERAAAEKAERDAKRNTFTKKISRGVREIFKTIGATKKGKLLSVKKPRV